MKSALLEFIRFESPHDGNHVRKVLLEYLDDWKIKNRLSAVTTDSGSEISKAMRLLKSDLSSSDFHVTCIAHVVNLAVKTAFGKIYANITSIRKVIQFIRLFGKRRERFEEIRTFLNLANISIPGLSVETRWSSTFHMLEGAPKIQVDSYYHVY